MFIKNLALSAVLMLLYSQHLIGQTCGVNTHLPAKIDGNHLVMKHGSLGGAHITCNTIELLVNDPESYLLPTWYFLGMAKTLDVLPDLPEDLIEEFKRAAAYLVQLQGGDGQWRVFADDQDAAPETSGTAGIATALAIGYRNGWLGAFALESARKASKALESRLTPDGFLDGVAEANKREGGETFQRSTKRGVCQWGMGLYAQLIAELNTPLK